MRSFSVLSAAVLMIWRSSSKDGCMDCKITTSDDGGLVLQI